MKPESRMKLLFFMMAFIFELTTTVAQPSTFLKTYNAGDMGYSVREANGVSYVVAGCTDFYYNFNWFTMSPIASTNVHLLKTTTDGTLIWEKTFNYPGKRTLATWHEHTSDDGFIITGRANQDLVWPPDSNDILLIKTDNDGVIQWSKFYDTGKDELGYCVRQTSDGGYVVSGFHDSAPLSLAGTTYAILIKTDLNGNVQWEKKYELAVRDLDTGESFPWVVKQTADGGYILTGTTVGSHAADAYVIRTDPSGNLIWAKSYEHDASEFRFSLGLDIIESSTGDFIVAGSMDKDQSLSQYNYPYILKLNSNGNILNAKFFDSAPAQPFQSGFSSVEETPDGGFFFTGMGGYSNFGMLAQLLKTDTDFNMQWSRAYSNDGGATIGSRSGRLTSDGCYVYTGKKVNTGTVLMKTDNLGLVPCKNPGTLLELLPSVLEVDRFPLTLTGINSNDVVFNTQVFLADTTTLCPVTIAILPVELLSFAAKEISGNLIQLDWKTASETNNDYFIVEKSTDGINFTPIGLVKGSGNSTINHNYSCLDKKNEGILLYYYRLQQVDYDGTRNFSPTISFHDHSAVFKLISLVADYPSQRINIHFDTNTSKNITFTLTDITGRACYQNASDSQKGLQKINLDVNDLSKGIYILSIFDGQQLLTNKISY